MKKCDIANVFLMFYRAFPSVPRTWTSTEQESVVAIWADRLKYVDPAVGMEAAKNLCTTSKFAPSLSEFYAECEKIAGFIPGKVEIQAIKDAKAYRDYIREHDPNWVTFKPWEEKSKSNFRKETA